MADNKKIVCFDLYCKTCKNANVPEEDEPCDSCLREYVKDNSKKPVRWEEKD